ncbi:MAG TPA: DUF167 family protein [Alphaproteobacteria bacterium]|nr:DUF167 family protein [Alphaproteobacteria bacterium]
MTTAPGPVTPVADGVRVAVRLTPGASRTGIAGTMADADGAVLLKVTVTAVAEGGKANAALIGFLAKEWRLPKGAFSLVSGATDRRKVLHVAGDSAELAERLQAALRPLA